MVNEETTDLDGAPLDVVLHTADLQVKVSVTENIGAEPSLAYGLTMEVVHAEYMDPNIFYFELVPVVPGVPTPAPHFVSVATPAYMQELPAGAPSEACPYYFRLSKVTLYYRSVDELNRSRDNLLRRIRMLLDGIEQLAVIREDSLVSFSFQSDETNSSIAGCE